MPSFHFTCAHLNELFSEELANTLHQGNETEDNHRYHWEDEFEVQDVLSVSVAENGEYHLKGTQGTGGDFSFAIPNMTVITLKLSNGSEAQFAISNQLIQRVEQTLSDQDTHMLVELKDSEPFANPITGIYIANHDFPIQLVAHARD
jgi:hypothetical protein